MSNGYVHTRDDLREMINLLVKESTEASVVAIIGQVGLVLAERLEAIVNVLEEMEKRL